MKEELKSEFCKNCGKRLYDNYCSNCGSPQELKRIDRRYITDEIGSVLNFDKGIFYTIRELLIRPGKAVREFMLEDRKRLVKPIVFIIVTSLIYTISQQLFHFEDGYVSYSFAKDTAANSIFEWISQNYGYSNFLMAIFIGFWIKIFFRKYNYNFFEILILLCFVMGMGMLLFSLFGIAHTVLNLNILDKGFLIGILYIIWAIGQFFDKKKFLSYLKAFLSYFLGLISFTFVVLLIGITIDKVL